MENQEKEVDFRKLWQAFCKFWVWIVAISFVVTAFTVTATYIYHKGNPSYVGQSKYLIVSASSNGASALYQSTQANKEIAPQMVDVIETTSTAEEILHRLKEAQPDAEIDLLKVAGMTSATVSDNAVVTVTVQGYSKADVTEWTKVLETYLPMFLNEMFFPQAHDSGVRLIDSAFHGSVSTISEAKPPILKNGVIALFVSLVLTYCTALIIYLCDHTVYNEDTLQNNFEGTPVLGVIPTWDGVDAKAHKEKKLHDYKNKVLSEKTSFSIAEAFRSLRANVSYTVSEAKEAGRGVVIAMTSERNGEGKSIVCSNLAITYAKLKKRVLLVEGDMRRPALHAVLGFEDSVGLSEVLGGTVSDYHTCLVREYADHLDILPAGKLPTNPAELLASEQMKSLVTELRGEYDVILIDMPPLGVVFDAGLISSLVDSYLLAVRADYSNLNGIARILREMGRLSMHVSGFVLTDVYQGRREKFEKKTMA